jgi:6-phosphogluconolactonase
MTEYDDTLIALAWDAAAGTLKELQVEPALPAGYTHKSYGSDVQIHPSGRFVYGGNRGHDTLAAFSIKPPTGRVALIDRFPCGGKFPNSFRLDPAGGFVVVTNTNSNQLAALRIDQETGSLSPADTVEVTKPGAVCFW